MTLDSEAIQSKIQNKTEMIDIEAEGDIIIEENTEVNSYDEKTKEPDITDINEIDEYGRYKLLNKQLKKEELKRRYDIIVFVRLLIYSSLIVFRSMVKLMKWLVHSAKKRKLF